MSVLIILLIASISIAAIFLAAFLWGVKHKQFDDNYSPPYRILFDDKPSEEKKPLDID
ncbi:MAG: cbb3-type cytochrome oxidase assembly protein CcoS [Bacteroidota bacterium]|nr:cbb3-type cytochrome oxidase assembly protein CcoS [Bacteroidota bacterium]